MMDRNWLLVFFVFAMLNMAAVSGQSCEPDCTGLAERDYVPDPKNCSRYYICMAGGVPTDKPLPCGDGEQFHPESGCIPAYGCKPICASTGGCHLTCLNNDDYVADPFDCSVFYDCTVNGPGPANSCPVSFPHFNGHGCVNDESVCCHSECFPYCDELVIQVPDPSNCKRFYICDQGFLHGPFLCDPGETFDYGTAHCSTSAACRVWCTDNPIDPPEPPPPGCLEEFMCEEPGFFQMCPDCYQYYFFCESVGQLALMEKCPGDLIFNSVPEHPYCVLPVNCPYPPSIHEGFRLNSSVIKSQEGH